MSDPSAPAYDPFDAAVLASPFAAYEDLRQHCPVHFHRDFGDRGFYSLSRYGDVVDLFRDTSRWSADWGQGPLYVKEGGLKSDPPEHTRYRRLVTGAFTAARTAALEPLVRRTASDLIDAFVATGRTELVDSYGAPLPMNIIVSVLGVPADRGQEFKAWSDEFMAGQNSADPAVQGAARAKIDAFFAGELADRRARLAARPDDAPTDVLPDDVLTSVLLARDEDGNPFTDEQLLPLLLLLLVGGIETTTSLIGSLLARLLEFGLWEQVAADPTTWDAAIEESLRFDPPVLGLFRTANGDQTVHDVAIPDECKVEGLYASANRDPDVWDDPDTFRLDRTPADLRRHLSFGVGIWFCPGAALARLEAKMTLELFAARLPNLRIDGSAERKASFMMWGPAALPLAWDVT